MAINPSGNVHLVDTSTQFQVDPTLTSALQPPKPSGAPPPLDPQAARPPPALETPTQSAAETRRAKDQEIKQATSERLADNDEYQEVKTLLDGCATLLADFALVDKHTGLFLNDGKITLDNLYALVGDPLANADAKAAAQRLLDNQDIWTKLAKGDDLVGKQDVSDFIDGLKAKKREIEGATRKEVADELYPPKSSSSSSAATGGGGEVSTSGGGNAPAAGGGESGSTIDTSFHPPKPSDKPGMEGASENLAGTADALQDQMMRLAEQAAKDPANAAKFNQQIAMLQAQFQAITNMMSQLSQLMSNLSKMWSDVAMNSIRNLK